MTSALLIGLTGGIGSGKSTVAGMLAERGAAVIDADAISRATTAPGGAALPAIAQVFGPTLIGTDGALDRAAMRELVFRDASARQRLEAIIHPLVGQETDRQAQQALAKAEAGVIVLLRRPEQFDDILAALREQTPAQHPAAKWDPRIYGIGAQILRDLGVRKMKLMSSPRRMPSMTGFDLDVTGYMTSPSETE